MNEIFRFGKTLCFVFLYTNEYSGLHAVTILTNKNCNITGRWECQVLGLIKCIRMTGIAAARA